MAAELPLDFEFSTTAAPVQAEGQVAGRRFYFRARHEEWEFVVAERAEDDPTTLDAPDAAAGRGWYRSGAVPGGRSAASHLPLEEASALIRACAAAYVAERVG